MNQLDRFMNSPARSQWLQFGPLAVFVRRSKRMVEGKYVTALDIATVEVAASHRRQGHFSRLYELVRLTAQAFELDGVWIESIQEPVLVDFCIRRGGIKASSHDDSPNYFIPCEQRTT